MRILLSKLRNKRTFLYLYIFILFFSISFGKIQSPEDREKALKAFDGVEIPQPNNINAFGVGEYLDFGIYVALPGVGKIPLKGGNGILEVVDIVDRDNHICYWLRIRALSSGFIKLIYPVNDFIESFMDVDSFYPWYFYKKVKEGKYHVTYSIYFDQDNHIATRKNKFEVETYPKVQDIISAFYYIRTLEFSPKDTIPLPYHDNGGNYPISIIVHRRETVEVPAGTFQCIVIEPVIKTEGLFRREGRMEIWLTDDYSKMPVKMVSKIPIGSVQALLLEYQVGDKDWRSEFD